MEDIHVHAFDYVSAFRRRVWWLVVPIALGAIAGVVLLSVLPKQYRSSATLGVSAPLVSPNLVNQSAPFDNQERLRAISQQLLSTPILTRVAREENAAGASDADVAHLRKAITVTVPDQIAPTNEPRHLDTFVIAYNDTEPARAQRIANRLATVFVDENSKVRTEHAADTSQFINAQLRASQARLDELEAKLRRAKESHMGQLPEQLQANLQTVSGLRQQLESNATTLRGEQDRLSMIDRQIDAFNQSVVDAAAPKVGDPQPAEVRVASLEHDLANARTVYTDRHPEVQRMEQELAAAKKDVAAQRQRPETDRLAQLQRDPAYRQLVADRDMTRLRIADLQRAGADEQRQISQYQSRVEAAPMVEQQLAALQRDFDLEKQQYSDLSAKLHAASMAEDVARTRGGEQFAVMYPASLPTDPVTPIPMRVMLIAIFGGLCVGVALTLGREYFDRSVHNSREIKDELDLPVLGEIAHIPAYAGGDR